VGVDISVDVGSAAIRILERSAQLPADLIVMGTHGRRGLSHMFLGSVAERLVRTAPCPVLTLRADRRQPVVVEADPSLAAVPQPTTN
jgi:nucleotide-binding universal stress UspA family protein